MEEEKQEISAPEDMTAWREEHPWLAEESDLDEVVRYSLDEIRIA